MSERHEPRAAEPGRSGMSDPLSRRLRLLAVAYGAAALAVAAVAVRPTGMPAWALLAAQDGLAAGVAGALLIAAAGLAATGVVHGARVGRPPPAEDPAHTRLGRLRLALGRWLLRPAIPRPVWAAGWPQTLIILGLAGSAAALAALRWPQAGTATGTPHDRYLLGGALLAGTFPLLVAERTMAGLPSLRLPEARDLAQLMRVPVVLLPAWGALEVVLGLGVGWAAPVRMVLALVVPAVAAELMLRLAARWFLPPPDAGAVRAAVTSLAAGALRPQALSPAVLSRGLRDRFGIDFQRSWALAYVRGAALPVAVALLLFCWFLSGVVAIGIAERGSYERFGAPVAMLGPGLHLIAPWPFGRVRRVEYGVLHSVAVTAEEGQPMAEDRVAAEDPAPAGADRLWERPHPSEGSFLIASESDGRQGFQVVSADIRVLYRIGLGDGAGRQAAYNITDADALVRAYAGRRLSRFFASQTLLGILGEGRGGEGRGAAGEDRARIAAGLEAVLQGDMDGRATGIEVVAVVIEAIHPPSGAADAYHNVQAAEIAATATISAETGRAAAETNLARETAEDQVNKATAAAAERVAQEDARFRAFRADVLASRAAGPAFPLERYLGNLSAALRKAPLAIVDHRLDSRDAPVLDLRPLAGAAAATGPED